jgi:hypothetical protein
MKPMYAAEAKEKQRQSPVRQKRGTEIGEQKVAQVKRESQARDRAAKATKSGRS